MTDTQNGFLTTLRELRGGETMLDLHREIEKLVGDVRAIEKAGSITLTVKFSLAKGTPNTLLITDEIKVNTPKADREVTILFADDSNRLSRRDPRQPRLPGVEPKQFRPRAVGESANTSTGEISE